jgi:hypothetical protein
MISLAALTPLQIRLAPYATVKPEDIFKEYSKNFGEWLLNGFSCFQTAKLRQHSFEPIQYLIGTSQNEYHYIDSLCDITRTLEQLQIRDRDLSIADEYSSGFGKTAGDALLHGALYAFDKLISEIESSGDSAANSKDALIDLLKFSGMAESPILPDMLPRLTCATLTWLGSETPELTNFSIEILDAATKACNSVSHTGAEKSTIDFLQFVAIENRLPDQLRCDATLMYSLCTPEASTDLDNFFSQPLALPITKIEGWNDWIKETLGVHNDELAREYEAPIAEAEIVTSFVNFSPRQPYPKIGDFEELDGVSP